MQESTGDMGTVVYGHMETWSYLSMVNIEIDIMIMIIILIYPQVNSGASLGSTWSANLSVAGITLRTLSGLTLTFSI